MNLILKIAAGVLLGILAAFAVYKTVDIWERQALAKKLVEQEQLEEQLAAKAQQARISTAARRLHLIKPDRLIALCGSPLEVNQPEIGIRGLRYKGADGRMVYMGFAMDRNLLFYMGMHQADKAIGEPPKKYENFLATDGNYFNSPES